MREKGIKLETLTLMHITYLISRKSFERSRRSSDYELFIMITSKVCICNKGPEQETVKGGVSIRPI